MELRQLRYFALVAEELNFTRAARRLHVAQPALSRQIKQLEEELGVVLFDRNKRQVLLTPAGARFLKEAKELIAHTARAMQSVRDPNAESLSIGYVWGLFHAEVPPILQHFREQYSDFSINLFDLSATAQCSQLLEGKLDAGFIGFGSDLSQTALGKHKVKDCSFVLALPLGHPATRKKRVSLSDFADEIFLLISEDHFPGAAQIMRAACADAGFQPRTLQTAERGHTILSLVAAGCGMALLPESLMALPHSGVTFKELSQPVSSELYLAWKNPVRSEGLRIFLESVTRQETPRRSP